MNRQEVLNQLAEQAEEIRRRFSIKDLAIFGSVARDEAGVHSDVDMLVTFRGRADFDLFMNLKFYLEDLLDMQVDLVTQKALRPHLRTEIEREAIHVA